MNRTTRYFGMTLLLKLSLIVPGVWAQQPMRAEPQSSSHGVQTPQEVGAVQSVPRLVKFAGTLKDELGKPLTGVTSVTFAVYKEQEGGAGFWLETQNVELDEQGRYTVLLGVTKSEGMPLELFTSGEPRWLGVQVNLPGEVEQPRVLLVSVPYALKAADADTVGGLPASAFMLAQPTGTASGTAGASLSGTTARRTTSKTAGQATAPAAAAIAANFIPVFTDNIGTLGSSAMFQSGNNIGVGTTSPAAPLHVNGNTLLVTSATTTQVQFSGAASAARFGEDGTGAFFASDTPGKAVRFYTNNGTLNEGLRIDSSSNVGIGTATPAAKLDVNGAFHVGTGNNWFRVEGPVLGTANPVLASWGGSGDFQIDAPGVIGGRFVVKSSGNVGIGTANPSSFSKLDVEATTAANPIAIFAQTSQGGGFSAINGQSLSTGSIGTYGANFGGGGLPGFLTFNIGVAGQSNNGIGVEGSVETGTAVSGRVGNSAGEIFSGVGPGGAEQFNVSSVGTVHANAFQTLSGIPIAQYISLQLYGANIAGGASFTTGFGPNAGMQLPNSGVPSFAYEFTIPPNFISNSPLTVHVIWYTSATSCTMSLAPNFISVARAGRAHIIGVSAASGLTAVGSNTLSAGASANVGEEQQYTITSPDGVTSLNAGDVVVFGLFRTSSGVSDCAANLAIEGVSITY